jgi:hypothetical protein
MNRPPIWPGAFADLAPDAAPALSDTPELQEAPLPEPELTPAQREACNHQLVEARFKVFMTQLAGEVGEEPFGAMLVVHWQRGVGGALTLARGASAPMMLKIVDALVGKVNEVARGLKVRINSICKG